MLALLRTSMPDVVPVVPVSPVVAATVEQAVHNWPVRPIVVTDVDDKHDAFAAAGAALTKSGTSTLELALAGVPMAVTYRVNPLTAFMARRLIRVPYVAMVNLLAGRAVVPELLQENCAPDVLAREVQTLFENPTVAQARRRPLPRSCTGWKGRGRACRQTPRHLPCWTCWPHGGSRKGLPFRRGCGRGFCKARRGQFQAWSVQAARWGRTRGKSSFCARCGRQRQSG